MGRKVAALVLKVWVKVLSPCMSQHIVASAVDKQINLQVYIVLGFIAYYYFHIAQTR